MTPFDVRLIDPTFGELVTAVLSATRVANGRSRANRIDKDASAWHRALRRVFRQPGGRREWPGKHSLIGMPLVKVAWWTDPLGRKHWRVVGTRRAWADVDDGHSWPLGKHDLWHVYPERLFWRKAGGREELVAACGCGVAGTPQAICWTGLRCGPCHDRREEGAPLPAERPARLERRRHDALVYHITWLPDGRLVTGGADGRIVLWEADGASRVLLHRRGGTVQSLAVSAAGVVAACTSPTRLLLRDVNRDEDWRTVPLPGGAVYGRGLVFSPDGSRLLVCSGDSQTLLLDLAEAAPVPRPVGDGWLMPSAAFAPGGEAVYTFDQAVVVRVEVATGEATVVRAAPTLEDVGGAPRDDLDLYFEDDIGVPPLVACSADVRWLVAVGIWGNHFGLHRCHLPSGEWAPLRGPGYYFGWRSVAFSGPDELMATNGDGTVSVWALADGALKATWCTGARPMHRVTALSPDGTWLAQVGGGDEVILYPWREVVHAAG